MEYSIPIMEGYTIEEILITYKADDCQKRVYHRTVYSNKKPFSHFINLNQLNSKQDHSQSNVKEETIFNVKFKPGVPYSDVVKNLHTYISLISGAGFSKHIELASLLNFHCPTETTLLAHLKSILPDLEKVATASCEANIQEILKHDSEYKFNVSLDCAWSSKRDALHAVITLIDINTNKILDFRIVSRHPELIKFKSPKILVEPKISPGLMESYALRDMLKSDLWKKIKVFCSDGDVKDSTMIENSGAQLSHVRDPNHVIKSAFSKIVTKYPKFEKIFRILFACPTLKPEQKVQRWMGLINRYPGESPEHIEKREIITNIAPLFLRISKQYHTNFNEAFNSLKAHLVPKNLRWIIGFPARIFVSVFAYNEDNWKTKLRRLMGIDDSYFDEDILQVILNFENKSDYDHIRRTSENYRNHNRCVHYIPDEIDPEFADLVPHKPLKDGSRSEKIEYTDDEDPPADEEPSESENLSLPTDYPKFNKKSIFGSDIKVPPDWKRFSFFFKAKEIPDDPQEFQNLLSKFKQDLYNTYSSLIRINEENISAVAVYDSQQAKEIMNSAFTDFHNFEKIKINAINYLNVLSHNPPSLEMIADFHPDLIQLPQTLRKTHDKPKKQKLGIKLGKNLSFLAVIVQLITFRPLMHKLFDELFSNPNEQQLIYKEILSLTNRNFSENADVTYLYHLYSKRQKIHQADPIDAFKQLQESLACEARQLDLIDYFKKFCWGFTDKIDIPLVNNNELQVTPTFSDYLFIDVAGFTFPLDDYTWNNNPAVKSKLVAIITYHSRQYNIIILDENINSWILFCNTKISYIRDEELANNLNKGAYNTPKYLIFEKI